MNCRLLISLLLFQSALAQQPNQQLWYRHPAVFWNSQALHLGNGFMGASFFGGVDVDTIALTEQSIWSGEPGKANGVNPNAKKYLGQIRQAVVDGDIALSDSLTAKYYLGDNKNFGSFTSIGDLIITQSGVKKPYTEYRRELDIEKSLGRVEYKQDGVGYSREYFCSYPNRVLAIKLKADKKGALDLSIGMKIIQKQFTVHTSGNSYIVDGTVDQGVRKFRVKIMAIAYGGKVSGEDHLLKIKQADSLVLLVNASTDYRLQYPDYKGEDPVITADSIIEAATSKGYESLKQAHEADYSALYSRVKLELDDDPALDALPTDERWLRLKKGKQDLGLKELVFNLGRYLIISSSRPGTLPANLQGKWNTFYRSPWAGNYQSNINIQEIYWSCGPTNLRECGEPYVDWIKDLVVPGREIAQQVYGTAGWISHTTGNIYGNAAPTGAISYGVYPMASVWHCRHLWDQYSFSMDTSYLAKTAYPLIKEAVRFWLLNLVPFKGCLIVAPSVSAEHGAYLAASPGRNNAFSAASYGAVRYTIPGASQDAEMLRDLFSICIDAAEQLNTDKTFRDSVEAARSKLLPFKIGRFGQLQEWSEDIDAPDDHHRHIAHLYAVAPAGQISPFTTPRLAAAAKVSLDIRGDKRYPDDPASGGNWSRAWRMWCWARLLDGNRADKIFTELLTDEGFENLLTFQQADYHWNRKDLFTEGDSLYLHFQLDASASTPGFIAELLLQSQLGELDLLPALPDAWKNGSVSGLKARGGYTVGLKWKDLKLVKAVIRSRFSQVPKIRIGADYIDPATDKRIELHLNEH